MPANVETMAYAGETPWRGLGHPVDEATTVDEMLVAAELDWPVETARVSFNLKDPETGRWTSRTDEKHNVLYRATDGQVLDVVGPRYVPFQNEQILEFFREYVEAGEMHLETAGSLDDGRTIWALAKMDEAFTVQVPDDRVEGYVLLVNPHQYGKSAEVKFTGVRVVCWNTLTAALREGGRKSSLRLWHTREFNETLRNEAKRRLGIAREQLEAYQRDAELLASLDVSDETALRVIATVMRGDPDQPEPEHQNRRTLRVFDLFKGEGLGSHLSSAEGTAWGVFNAVTQYQDHEYGRSRENRLKNAWLGGGERVKQRTLDELLALAV